MLRTNRTFRPGKITTIFLITTLFVGLALAFFLRGAPSGPVTNSNATNQARENYLKTDMSFEANQGQFAGGVRYASRGGGYGLYLEDSAATLALVAPKSNSVSPLAIPDGTAPSQSSISGLQPQTADNETSALLKLKWLGGNSAPKLSGAQELPGKVNYFTGSDPTRWQAGLTTYQRVQYSSIYPGVDLVFYGQQRQLEYDFVLAPGADPSLIKLDFEGADELALNDHGELVLKIGGKSITQKAPFVYQEDAGTKKPVEGHYKLYPKIGTSGGFSVGFELGQYNSAQPLVIDPVLIYSTYLGGSSVEYSYGIGVDGSLNTYVVGETYSLAPSPFSGTFGGNSDVFVTKLNINGTALLYSTYLGSSGYDTGKAIAVDSTGNAYLTGSTTSSSASGGTPFPTTSGAYQTSNAGEADAFVTKLDPSGALTYSTYLGGSSDDFGNAIAINANGNVFVAGHTFSTASGTPFPTSTPYQSASGGKIDGFVARLNTTGTALDYSTYLGGAEYDYATGIAVDASDNAYLTGFTGSLSTSTPPFPITAATAYQPANGGGFDAFLVKLNSTGNGLLYSTFLGGGASDYGSTLAIDGTGNAYITGFTMSAAPTAFPTLSAAQGTNGGYIDAFVTKLNTNVSGTAGLVYSTYLGGGSNDYSYGLAIDGSGNAYIAGYTQSTNFPTAGSPVQATNAGDLDAFVAQLNPAGNTLVYSTYLGGGYSDYAYSLARDTNGVLYVTGNTYSVAPAPFPTTNLTYQATNAGVTDAFIFKLGDQNGSTISLTSAPNPSIIGQSVTFTATVSPLSASGTVTFTEGVNTLGSAILSSGVATYTTSSLSVGSHSIKATYGGDSNYSGSTSNTVNQVVNLNQTTLALTSAPNPSLLNQSVTFTATVSPIAASGTVTFTEGANVLGTGTLAGGVATFSTSSLSVGSHSISATYGGDSNYAGSTSTIIVQVVNTGQATLTLTSAPNPSILGQSVTFTATISPITATGTVTFTEGITTLGSAPLSGGVATFSTSSLTIGSHNISATYGGDSNYAGTTSNTVVQIVNCNPSSLVVTSNTDDGTGGTCGTFSYALIQSSAGMTITFALTQSNTITFTGALTPTVKSGVTIDGGAGITLNGGGITGDGIRLQGSDTLINLVIRNFAGRELVTLGPGNKLQHVVILQT